MKTIETGTGIKLFSILKEQLKMTKDPRDAERAAIINAMLAGRGTDLVYHPNNSVAVVTAEDLLSKVFPQISLSEEHRRQGLINARKYAGAFGMGQDEYIATLPQFPERPSAYENELGLTVPVIVENRRSWLKLAELSDIHVTDYLRAREAERVVKNWEKDEFKMDASVISMWVQDGSKFVYRKPLDVRAELLRVSKYREHYKAGRIPMGIALQNVRPDMVRSMFWDLIGTSVGSGRCACLRHWDDQARLYAVVLGYALPGFRGFVFGSKTETLSLAA